MHPVLLLLLLVALAVLFGCKNFKNIMEEIKKAADDLDHHQR